ncbi:MAG: serine/threonine-protein kinase [Gemmatimonadales bacterium]|nr:serine/threonine-protein kinase [Gemmatimonadales bacterium]
MPLRPLAGRYELGTCVGSGGTAHVYRARDLRHGRVVAVKLLREEVVRGFGTDRFLREIAALARLQHPHIVPLLDSGEEDGRAFLVMPFIEESLRAKLRREGVLPVAEALAFAAQVADGLAHAHANGILHRDIKPENILLQDGEALVSDFGMARFLIRESDWSTSGGLAVGTPAYMSPEQIAASRTLDARSDVYALGCVLHEMLAGQPPFTGATVQIIASRHLTEPPPPVTGSRPVVSPSVQRVLARALAKLPADRQASARTFGDEVRLADASPAEPRPPEPLRVEVRLAEAEPDAASGQGASRWATRGRPLGLLLAGGALLALALRFSQPWGPPASAVTGVTLVAKSRMAGVAAPETGPLVSALGALDHARVTAAAPDVTSGAALAEARARGDRYIATLALDGEGEARVVSAEVRGVGDERVRARIEARGAAAALALLADSVAFGVVRAIAGEERIATGRLRALLTATTSGRALGHLAEAQRLMARSDFAGAERECRAALQADSNSAIAWRRLAVALDWQEREPDALIVLAAGLARGAARLVPAWGAELLSAEAAYLRGDRERAISAFERLVVGHATQSDVVFGLAEARFHLGLSRLETPMAARVNFERHAELEGPFLPTIVHRADLAIGAGDLRAAEALVGLMPPDFPEQRARQWLVRVLRHGLRPGDVAEARAWDRKSIGELVSAAISFADRSDLADSVAVGLAAPGRPVADRLRGIDYLLLTRQSQPMWPAALELWDAVAADSVIDGWVAAAALAGHPVGDRLDRMLMESRLRLKGRAASFTPDYLDAQTQAAILIATVAAARGSPRDVRDARAVLQPAASAGEPLAAALAAALDARAATLAGDAAAARRALQRSIDLAPAGYDVYFPLLAMTAQRRQLAQMTRGSASVGVPPNSRALGDHFGLMHLSP